MALLTPACRPFTPKVRTRTTPNRCRLFAAGALAAWIGLGCTTCAIAQAESTNGNPYRLAQLSLEKAATIDDADASVNLGSASEPDPYHYYVDQLRYAEFPPTAADGAGLWSDTKYLFAYQFFIIGVLYVLPESTSNWSSEQKEKDRIGAYRDNMRAVVWDEDDHSVNYIGHPYFGSLYYTRARERGYDRAGAFWYAAGLSAAYEFGLEALFEPPSIQDLVTTPVLGSLLGYWVEGVRNNIRKQALLTGEFSGSDKFILGATDFLGYLNSYARRVFGKNPNNMEVEASLTPPAWNSAKDTPMGLWLRVQL